MAVTVCIIEDVLGTRETLIELFRRTADIQCIGAFADAESAVRAWPQLRPDVALIDIKLPGKSGIECVGELKRQHPELQVLMLTTYEETELIFKSLRAGANGYLLKNLPAEELIAAVREVRAGGAPMSMQIARKVVAHFHPHPSAPDHLAQLTQRESEILRLLAKGFLYKEIAEKLGITMGTVRTHIHTVYGKLHVQTRTEAVVKYLDREKSPAGL